MEVRLHHPTAHTDMDLAPPNRVLGRGAIGAANPDSGSDPIRILSSHERDLHRCHSGWISGYEYCCSSVYNTDIEIFVLVFLLCRALYCLLIDFVPSTVLLTYFVFCVKHCIVKFMFLCPSSTAVLSLLCVCVRLGRRHHHPERPLRRKFLDITSVFVLGSALCDQ